jgi:radical SAM protein with 4Fe4S-binding SPASM domain
MSLKCREASEWSSLLFSVKVKTNAVMIRENEADRLAELGLDIRQAELQQVLHDETLVGSVEEFCAPPSGPLEEQDATETLPCSAGHTACYVSPYGDVYPCVQFPLPSGNVRRQKFIDIWRYSPQFQEVRSISMADLQGCGQCVHSGTCSRCPGLAYMEGNMRGPSTQDCEKSFARTGIPSENLKKKRKDLVQIGNFR